jgi:hypothetical protein
MGNSEHGILDQDQLGAKCAIASWFENEGGAEQRIVLLLLVVFAFDLVGVELDVGDSAGDGVDSSMPSAGELGHRLGGIDLFGACRLVEATGMLAPPNPLASKSGISALAVPRRSSRTILPPLVKPS